MPGMDEAATAEFDDFVFGADRQDGADDAT
jgi:hypothetical protein